MLNCNVSSVAWDGLIEKHPYRMLNILNILLEEHINEITTPQANSDGSNTLLLLRHSWHDYQIDSLKELAIDVPEELLTDIAPKIFEIVSCQIISTPVPVDKKYYWLHKSRFSSNKPREHLIENLIELLILAGERVSDDPAKLYSLLTLYLPSQDVIVEYIIANLMLNLSEGYANQVTGWLLMNPDTRLACGNKYEEPKWVLSGKLIRKFSPYCDDTLFKQLEDKILNIGISKKIESIESIFYSRKKHGYFKNSYWGEVQYFLLNKLDANRISLESINLYQVLQRRFKDCDNTYFYEYNSSMGGAVVSPLPQPNILSDKTWKKLVTTPLERMHGRKWRQIDELTIAESTVYTFSRSLETAVKNEPIRFANLALTLPKDINSEFIESIYYGIADTNPSNLADKFKENWQPCPLELCYKVVEHFEDFSESQSLTRLLAGNPKIINYPKMLDKLIDISFNSTNPENSKLNVYNPKKGHNPDDTTVENLLMNSINCYRGIAYEGIAKIFWEDKEYALCNTCLVESAIHDPHPAVKIVAVRLLTPYLNYDEQYALHKFLELCRIDSRMTCAYQSHHFFNSAFIEVFKDNYVALVKQMSSSKFDEVRKQAGRQIFARYIFNDLFSNELEEALNGIDEELILGIAEVLVQFITMNDYAEHEYKLVRVYKILIESDSKKVRDKIGFCIREKNYWNKRVTKYLFRTYIDSDVRNINLYHLFYALENHVGALNNIKGMILELISKIIQANLSTDNQVTFRIDADKLTKILQRIYDEAVDDEDEDTLNMCLDIWDEFLKSDSYAVRQASKQLETGLLS